MISRILVILGKGVNFSFYVTQNNLPRKELNSSPRSRLTVTYNELLEVHACRQTKSSNSMLLPIR